MYKAKEVEKKVWITEGNEENVTKGDKTRENEKKLTMKRRN